MPALGQGRLKLRGTFSPGKWRLDQKGLPCLAAEFCEMANVSWKHLHALLRRCVAHDGFGSCCRGGDGLGLSR